MVELRPHNKELVNKIDVLIECGVHSIFYTEATGLGKSYIMKYLLEKYFKDKAVLYLVRDNVAWRNLTTEFPGIENDIDYRCYAAFNKESAIDKFAEQYDVIFTDEAHHLRSAKQGVHIRACCEKVCEKGGYVFGMTATPYTSDVKDEKNIINVGDFFKAQVKGLDINEATEAGLFPKVEYALSFVNKSCIPPELRKFYNKSRHVLLSDIINDNPDISHWVVFLPPSGKKKINIFREQIMNEFKNFHILEVSYKMKDNIAILDEYAKYEGKALMISTNMLLEVHHIKHVEAAVCYRSTENLNVFIQMNGRLSHIGSIKSPLFIDMVDTLDRLKNTIANLKKIGAIKQINNPDGSIKYVVDSTNTMFNTTLPAIELIKIVEKYVNSINKDSTPKYHRDINYNQSVSCICDDLGIDRKKGHGFIVNIKRTKGLTLEEAKIALIDATYDGHFDDDDTPKYHRGINANQSVPCICNDLGIDRKKGKIFVNNIKYAKGLTLEEAKIALIDATYDGHFDDDTPKYHRGINANQSVPCICNDLGIDIGKGKNFVNGIKYAKGLTLEEAKIAFIDAVLDGYFDDAPKYHRDINHNQSVPCICNDLGIDRGKGKSFVNIKRTKGLTLEEAKIALIDATYDGYFDDDIPKYHRDINHNQSVPCICNDLGIDRGKGKNFINNIKRTKGLTLEEAKIALIDATYDGHFDKK